MRSWPNSDGLWTHDYGVLNSLEIATHGTCLVEGLMERKKVVIDLEQIGLLEQRVVKATELIRSLRKERDAAQARLERDPAGARAAAQRGDPGSTPKREEVTELSEPDRYPAGRTPGDPRPCLPHAGYHGRPR